MLSLLALPVTTEFVRALSHAARRADEELAATAARNAAESVAERHARRLEDARTLRDLRRIGVDPAEIADLHR